MTFPRKTYSVNNTHFRHSCEGFARGRNPYKFPTKSFCFVLFLTLPLIVLWPARLIIREGLWPTLSLIIPASLIFITAHFFRKRHRLTLGIVCVGLLVLAFSGALTHNSLAKYIGENKQKIALESPLYPTAFLGRVYTNKFSLFIQKYEDNFFSLLDPNRYFFGSHPREGQVYGQNYIKLPLVAIFVIVFGLAGFPIFSLLAIFISLSFVHNLGNYDFFAFPFFVVMIHSGVKNIFKRKSFFLYALLFLGILVSSFEFLLS